MQKLLFLLLSVALSANDSQAQSIVGSWRTISQLIVNEDGSKKDLMVMQTRRWACMADLQTIFEANGKQLMKTSANCSTPINYDKLPPSDWKMTGHNISITNKSTPGPLGTTATYTVEFSGNKAILTHEYSTAEKQQLPGSAKIKKVVITYQRL